ncbi:MAG TPA: YceI family protein [Saprospiraceae bacterium]|nr:YceI family protein [Saprospiraceae bacterium]
MKPLERYFITLSLLYLLPCTLLSQTSFYRAISGKVALTSRAPLELISARTTRVQAIIDPTRKSFRFTIPISSFEGFNSALQRQHFNTNYMESGDFPEAAFSGAILEDIDFSKDGQYEIRAKGMFTVHGVSRERIIRSTIKISQGRLFISSNFSVLLEDHNIRIPKIVNQKIAEEIQIQVSAELAQS